MPIKKEKITFTAIKIASKPVRINFVDKNGKQVDFKAKKYLPKAVKVEFFTKKKSK
jgi:hypothetical protein